MKYAIEEDITGYAPAHLRFGYFNEDGKCLGRGSSVEDCIKQIEVLSMDDKKEIKQLRNRFFYVVAVCVVVFLITLIITKC